MISLFKNKAKQKQDKQNTAQDKIAIGIVSKVVGIQEKCAAYMQRKSERLSMPIKRGFVIAFCLLSGSLSIYLIVKSFTSQQQKAFSVSTIKLPAYSGKTGHENTKPLMAVTEEEYQKIQRFRRFMDSLSLTPSGKKILDHILIARPGLMDSIRFIENIHHLQSSNK